MATNSHSKGYVSIQGLLRRVILLLALLSASQTTPVHAAGADRPQAKTIVTINLTIRLSKEPICAHKSYYALVIAKADIDIPLRKGKVSHVSEDPQNGVTIESSVTNPDIGTLSPKKLVSGEDFLDNPGESTFFFNAEKAGTTILQFRPTYAGKKGKMEEIAIKVVNCEYKVTMNATDIDSRDGVTIWTTGDLETKITGDASQLTGNGNFEFVSGFVGPPCSISYSGFDNPTTITGQLDNNGQLTLQFNYEPGQITSNVSCPEFGGSASQQIDLTNTGIASATFPQDGGTQMIRFTYAGSDMAPGTMIIHVEPVSAQAGS